MPSVVLVVHSHLLLRLSGVPAAEGGFRLTIRRTVVFSVSHSFLQCCLLLASHFCSVAVVVFGRSTAVSSQAVGCCPARLPRVHFTVLPSVCAAERLSPVPGVNRLWRTDGFASSLHRSFVYTQPISLHASFIVYCSGTRRFQAINTCTAVLSVPLRVCVSGTMVWLALCCCAVHCNIKAHIIISNTPFSACPLVPSLHSRLHIQTAPHSCF